MTLAGDINETGHLDGGIFPAFYMCQLSPVPACLPTCLPVDLPGWLTGWLAGWLAG